MSDRPEEPTQPQPTGLVVPAGGVAVGAGLPQDRPSIADAEERSLDPQSIMAARLTGGIWAAVAVVILFVALLIVLFAAALRPPLKLLLLAIWAVASAVPVFFTIWWPAIRYRFTSYRVGRRGIRIRRGVLWRTVISVPKSRVQHTDVSQGPIERAYDLATLIVHTAGTHNSSVALGGLPRDVAFRIRDHLIGGAEDDAV